MSLIYEPDTDTVVKDTEPSDDNSQTENEDWREKGGKGTFDPPNFPEPLPTSSPPSTPPDESPDDSEGTKSKGPATRYDEIVLDQLAKAGFSGKDLGDAGIRITHHLGAEQGLIAKELLDTLAGMTDDEIRDLVDKAMHDLTTVDREGNEKFDFARDYMQKLYAPRPSSSDLYQMTPQPPSYLGVCIMKRQDKDCLRYRLILPFRRLRRRGAVREHTRRVLASPLQQRHRRCTVLS